MTSVDSNSNRDIVMAFIEEAFERKSPQTAFERWMGPDFIEHKADVPLGTRAAVASYLRALMEELPEARWEVLRTVAEGDLVAVHVRFFPEPDAPPYAIVDLFRLADGLIVEHWDVVAPPHPEPVNPNPRF